MKTFALIAAILFFALAIVAMVQNNLIAFIGALGLCFLALNDAEDAPK